MSFLQYSFLVSDLDGTLLNSNKKISDENLRSINLFRRMGGLFTLATGRSYTEAKRFIEQLQLNVPVILCNGAMLYEPATRSLTPIQTMARDVMMKILLDIEQKLPSSIDMFVYGIDRVFGTKIGPLSAQSDSNDFKPELISSFEHLPDCPYMKAVAVAEPKEIHLLTEWSKEVDLPVQFVVSSDHYFEILPADASKGNAVCSLLKKLHLSPPRAAAVGDHCNDISMIQKVGLSAAVSNAHPSLLQQAKVIVPSNNEHGISRLIHDHLLLPIPIEKTP